MLIVPLCSIYSQPIQILRNIFLKLKRISHVIAHCSHVTAHHSHVRFPHLQAYNLHYYSPMGFAVRGKRSSPTENIRGLCHRNAFFIFFFETERHNGEKKEGDKVKHEKQIPQNYSSWTYMKTNNISTTFGARLLLLVHIHSHLDSSPKDFLFAFLRNHTMEV